MFNLNSKKHVALLGLCTLMVVMLFTLNSCDNKKEQIVINEIMASNHSNLATRDGELYDWIELKNISEEPVNLEGFSLVVESSANNQEEDNGANIKTWDLPNLEMKAGEYLVIFASKKDKADPKGELHTSFKLPSAGGTLKLMKGKNVTAEVSFEELKDDQCYRRLDDGTYIVSYEPTPGFDNNSEGLEKSYAVLEKQRTGPLRIWELHSKGNKNGEAWVEVKNVSDAPVNLQDYCLTTSMKDMSQWSFPQVTLQPGEFYVVNGNSEGLIMGKNKSVTLTKDGKFVDGMNASAAPKGTTAGRVVGKNGIFYFKEPTRGAENNTSSSRTPAPQDNEDNDDEENDNE